MRCAFEGCAADPTEAVHVRFSPGVAADPAEADLDVCDLHAKFLRDGLTHGLSIAGVTATRLTS